jgi:lipoprotein-releasing system permease protein
MSPGGGSKPGGRRSGLLLRPWPVPLLLALRYLRSTRKDAFTSFLSWVAAVGMALGVAVLILALAMLSGFQGLLKGQILARTAEIEITPAAGSELAVAARLEREPGVIGARRVLSGRGWLLFEGQAESVEVVGVSGDVPRSFPGAAGQPAGYYLGDRLAAQLGLGPGTRAELVSPRPTLTPLGPQPRLRGFALTGVFEAATTDGPERVLVPLETARALFPGEQERLEVDAGGLEPALALAPQLRALFPDATVRTWQDLNRPLLFALALEKRLTFVAVALIVLVAGLALVAALSLLIASKRRELGVLGTLGLPPAGLARIFLALGGLIAGGGAAVGALVGAGVAWVLDRGQFLSVPGDVFFVSHVPFELAAGDLAFVVGSALVVAGVAAFYAARRVSSLTPIEALRS